MTKDGAFTSEIVTLLKNGDVLVTHSSEREKGGERNAARSSGVKKQPRSVSKAKLLLCLLVARSPNQEDKIIRGMTDMIKSVSKVSSVKRNSLWFSATSWSDVVEVRVEQIFAAFEELVVGPLMADLLAVPLTNFALSLVAEGVGRSSADAAVSVVGSNVEFLPLSVTTSTFMSKHSLESLGIHLLLVLFKACEQARIRLSRTSASVS